MYIRAWYLAGYSTRRLAVMAATSPATIRAIINREGGYRLEGMTNVCEH